MNRRSKIGGAVLGAAALAAGLWFLPTPSSRVEDKVRAYLYDPDSAKFSDVTHNAATGAGCGYLNAKNRMGGYNGKTHFILLASGEIHYFPDGDKERATIEQKLEIARKELAYAQLMESMCSPS